MAVLFMSLVAAVVLAVLARSEPKPGANSGFPPNAVLAASAFGLLIAMLLTTEAVNRLAGPDSFFAQLDGSLQERTSQLISHVASSHGSVFGSSTAVFHQAFLAAALGVFAVMQRNRWR